MEKEFTFINKLEGYYNLLDSHDYILTNFLNESEQITIKNYFENRKIKVNFSYENTEFEMKRCVLSYYDQDIDFNIACFKIEYNKRFLELTHRNILGTLMHLGIKREMIGDIIIEDEIYIFVAKEISEFIKRNFISINNKPIELIYIENPKISPKAEYISKTIFVETMRLDSIVAKGFNLSRETAKEMINLEMVKVNHIVNKNPTLKIKVDDLISLRKKGRIKVNDILGNSKSGKQRVELLCLKDNK